MLPAVLPAVVQQIDPNVPVQIPTEDLTDWLGILDRVLGDVLTPAAAPLLDEGLILWRGLSLIIVVWTGLKISFSGSIVPWDVARLVIGLWIPWVMLRFYVDPVPGTAFSFPMTITAGANWLGRDFQSDVVQVLQGTLTALIDDYQARFTAAWSSMSLLSLFRTGSSALFTFAGSFGAGRVPDLGSDTHLRDLDGPSRVGHDRDFDPDLPRADVYSVARVSSRWPSCFGAGSGPSSPTRSTR